MLDSLIITLRETLEASLLISFLLVLSKNQKITFFWLFYSLFFGTALAFIVSEYMPQISDSFDGTGQEILFSGVLSSISIILLIIHFYFGPLNMTHSNVSHIFYPYLIITAVLLAISLEGAEIIIYIQSQLFVKQQIYSSVTGSLLGLGIGISTAVLTYYFLTQVISQYARIISRIFISLISAGMASQSLTYLMQAGIIENGQAIWNTNWILSETSVTGQLLYALIGYESSPTVLQFIIYSLILALSFLLPIIFYQFSFRLRGHQNVNDSSL